MRSLTTQRGDQCQANPSNLAAPPLAALGQVHGRRLAVRHQCRCTTIPDRTNWLLAPVNTEEWPSSVPTTRRLPVARSASPGRDQTNKCFSLPVWARVGVSPLRSMLLWRSNVALDSRPGIPFLCPPPRSWLQYLALHGPLLGTRLFNRRACLMAPTRLSPRTWSWRGSEAIRRISAVMHLLLSIRPSNAVGIGGEPPGHGHEKHRLRRNITTDTGPQV